MPLLTLCPTDDPRLAEATRALSALDAEVRAGQQTLAANAAALDRLLGHECLALARLEANPTFETAEAFSLWWDAGGERWLRSYLDPADRGLVVLPPDPRPAPALACPPQSPDCAATTRGWALEANLALTRHGAREASRAGLDLAACPAEPGPDGYARWWRCADRATRSVGALPLFALAPDSGWLVVRGLRGGCEILQLYRLPDGEAALLRRCPATAEHPAEEQLRAGRVDPAQLSELVWFLFLDPDVANAQRAEAVILPLPPTLTRARNPEKANAAPQTLIRSSNQSPLAWAFNGPSEDLTRAGTLTWPWSADASEDYADRLLLAVERSFVAGCSTETPGDLRAGALPTEAPTEAPGGHLLSTTDGLAAELPRLPRCED